MGMGLLLSVLSCHSISLLHTSDKWTEWGDACATMAFPVVYDKKLLFLPHGIRLKRLLGLPSTIAVCVLLCTRPYLQTPSPPLGILESYFLVFLLFQCAEWDEIYWSTRVNQGSFNGNLVYVGRKYRSLLWSKYPTSISSSLKMISFVSGRKALSVRASVVRHSTSTLEAMLTKASVAKDGNFCLTRGYLA